MHGRARGFLAGGQIGGRVLPFVEAVGGDQAAAARKRRPKGGLLGQRFGPGQGAPGFVDDDFDVDEPVCPPRPVELVSFDQLVTSPAADAIRRSYVDGRFITGSGETFATVNPATGETLARVEIADAATVDRAADAAERGQAVWAAMTGTERGRVLKRAADLLRGRIAFVRHNDANGPIFMLRAAQRLAGSDPERARAWFLEALEMSLVVGRATGVMDLVLDAARSSMPARRARAR